MARLSLVAPFREICRHVSARLLHGQWRDIVLQGWASTMMHLEFLRKHIDALLALSHDARNPAVSAKLRELADECRIILSVSDIADLAAGLKKTCEGHPDYPGAQLD
jgi:hypothetical protein